MGIKVTTPIGRVLWTDLTKPDQYGKYGVKVAFPLDTDISALEKAVNDAASAKWGAKIPKKCLMPIKDGNEEVNDDGEVWETSKDMRIVRFKTKRPPVVIGQDKSPMSAEEIYSGCYVRVRSDVFAFDGTSKGVSCQLDMMQFAKAGERIGGGIIENADDVFDEIEGDDDDPWG